MSSLTLRLLTIVQEKKKDILEIARAYGIANIRVFGSVVRDEARLDSDIDLLVDLEKGEQWTVRVAGIADRIDSGACAVAAN